jgi:hypothetical protein
VLDHPAVVHATTAYALACHAAEEPLFLLVYPVGYDHTHATLSPHLLPLFLSPGP